MDESSRLATRLWTSAQPTVAAFVASIVREPRDREDVLQETALAIFESIDAYDPTRSFNGWAIGVAKNQIGLYLRKRKRDRHVFSEATIANLESVFHRVAPPAQLDQLSECIEQLDGRARTLCELRYQEGLKPASISERISMSANAVAKALQRVREQLRDCIMQGDIATEGAVE